MNVMHAGESLCTMGFPPASLTECFVPDGGRCHSESPSLHVLYPQMKITCNGTIVRWRAAGEETFLLTGTNRNLNTVLSIWRERGAELQLYERVGIFTLGFCGNGFAVEGSDSVFECMLPRGSRVSVQTGDIIGVERMTTSLGFQIFYRRTASGTRVRANIVQGSSRVRLIDSDVILTDEPQISLTIEPAVDNHKMTTIPTVTAVPPTNITSQGRSNTAAKIIGAGSVVIILLIVMILVYCTIKRYRTKCRAKGIDTKTKEASQKSQKSTDVEADKRCDNQIVKTKFNEATYSQRMKKHIMVQHKEHYITVNRHKQVSHASAAKKRPREKENAPTIIINNNHKHSASHGLYASPNVKSSSPKAEQCSGARYQTVSGHDSAAVVPDEKIGCKQWTTAVYEKARVYEKAAVYERAAMYERAVTYERAVMYEKAPPVPLNIGESQD